MSTNRFSAMLNVRDGAMALDFYQRAFNAAILWQAPPEGGTVAQLSIAGAEFWVHDETLAHQNPAPPSVGGTTVRLMLLVDDPDAIYAQAIAAGAKIVSPVQDRNYGWRDGRLSDPFGHHWEIGKPLGPWPPPAS